MISQPEFRIEPWVVTETSLNLEVLAQSESVFALTEGQPPAYVSRATGRVSQSERGDAAHGDDAQQHRPPGSAVGAGHVRRTARHSRARAGLRRA
jgi:hypothetical protein